MKGYSLRFVMINGILAIALVCIGNASGSDGMRADWTAMNELILPSGMTKAMLTPDTTHVYAGGDYGVIQRNGAVWRPLGKGLNGTVNALAIDKNGNIYAAGKLNDFGNIAIWDGKTWSPLGTGLGKEVQSIALDKQGNVFAAGLFDSVGGAPSNHVARWDGTSWTALNNGIDDWLSVEGNYHLAVDSSGVLYVAGNCTIVIGSKTSCVAKWDGAKWSLAGELKGSADAIVCDARGSVWVGGWSLLSSCKLCSFFRWDGQTWVDCSEKTKEWVVYELTTDTSGNLYAAMLFFKNNSTFMAVARYGGQSGWVIMDSSMKIDIDPVYSLSIDANGCLYAGGETIKQWHGVWWTYLQNRMNSVNVIHVDNQKNVFVGGDFTEIGGIAANNVAEWTDGSWKALGSGARLDVYALASDGKGNLYAGGSFDSCGGILVHGVAKWDGFAWSALGSGLNQRASSVFALACDNKGNLYAGGLFDSIGDIQARHIARWDGTAWSVLGDGLNMAVCTMVIDKSVNLYASGGFDSTGGVVSYGAAKWDGARWDSLQAGLLAAPGASIPGIGCLSFDSQDNLYAGGVFSCEFTFENGSVLQTPTWSNIAVWKEGHWCALGEGVHFWTDPELTKPVEVRGITFDDKNTLFTGGYFCLAGDNTSYWAPESNKYKTQDIALWNGNGWMPFATTGNNNYGDYTFNADGAITTVKIFSIAAADSFIFVGGNFSDAGTVCSPGIVKFKIKPFDAIRTEPKSSASGTVRFTMINATLLLSGVQKNDCVSLYSLSGRCIRRSQGVRRMELSGYAHQPMFVQVRRGKHVVSSGLVVLQ